MAAREVDGLKDARYKTPLIIEEVPCRHCKYLRGFQRPDVCSQGNRTGNTQSRRQGSIPIVEILPDQGAHMCGRWQLVVWLQEVEQVLQTCVADDGNWPHVEPGPSR